MNTKCAFITGASRGLGHSIAEELQNEYRLALGYLRNPPSLDAELLIRGDVSLSATMRSAAVEIEENFGRLDLLVANAAISRDRSLLKTSDADFDETIAVNVSGVFNALRSFAPLLARSNGSVVVIGSIIGRRGAAGSVSYAASKAALIGLALTAAREFAPDVNLNVVIPGYMDTDMGMASEAGMIQAKMDHLGGVLTPVEEAAEVVADVARLKTVTGQIFTADGRLARWF